MSRVGMAGFNTVWQSPDTLPLLAELTDPAAWITRVGTGGASALQDRHDPAPPNAD